jgi:hypothetical protein
LRSRQQDEGREDIQSGGKDRSDAVETKRVETTYSLEMEREDEVSDRGYDYKTKAGMTYNLEVEREGDVSDLICYKARAGTTYSLGVERVTYQIADEPTERGQG